MKVCDLIEALREYDQNQEVHFSYNYGDHWRTVVAPAIRTVEELEVVRSAYHDMDRLADGEGDDEDKPDLRMVVVLGS